MTQSIRTLPIHKSSLYYGEMLNSCGITILIECLDRIRLLQCKIKLFD